MNSPTATTAAALQAAQANLDATRKAVTTLEEQIRKAAVQKVAAHLAQKNAAPAGAKGDEAARQAYATAEAAQRTAETQERMLELALKDARKDVDTTEGVYYGAIADHDLAQAQEVAQAIIALGKKVDDHYDAILAVQDEYEAMAASLAGFAVNLPLPPEWVVSERHHVSAFGAAVLRQDGGYERRVRAFPGVQLVHPDYARGFATIATGLAKRITRANPERLRRDATQETTAPGSSAGAPVGETVRLYEPKYLTPGFTTRTFYRAVWLSDNELEYEDIPTGQRRHMTASRAWLTPPAPAARPTTGAKPSAAGVKIDTAPTREPTLEIDAETPGAVRQRAPATHPDNPVQLSRRSRSSPPGS